MPKSKLKYWDVDYLDPIDSGYSTHFAILAETPEAAAMEAKVMITEGTENYEPDDVTVVEVRECAKPPMPHPGN